MSPIQEISSHAVSYCVTTNATPAFLADYYATINPGESVWIEARVKAVNTTRSWYAAVVFFCRRIGTAAPIIRKKVLGEYAAEGKIKWDIDVVAVGVDRVALVCIGDTGQTVSWAVSARGFESHVA